MSPCALSPLLRGMRVCLGHEVTLRGTMGKDIFIPAKLNDDYNRKLASSFLSPVVEIKQSVIVCGPKGCGKSRNALSLSSAFGLKRIIDEWIIGSAIPGPEVLILTTEKLVDLEDHFKDHDFRIMTFRDAMKIVRPNG